MAGAQAPRKGQTMKKDMQKLGQYNIWLTGSRKYTTRVVYRAKDGKKYIVWYGNMIEVKYGARYYYTVEQY